MTSKPIPTVAAYPLPLAALRAPLPARTADAAPQASDPPSHHTTAPAQATQISEIIARRARQRRYTG